MLSALVDGQLAQDATERVRAHVDECARCRQDLQVLQSVGGQLAVLKHTIASSTAPAGLMTGLRSLPDWVVRLAVIRRWLISATGLAACGGLVVLLLRWSGPLPATLTAQQAQQATPALTPGTTLMARPGEPVSITLPHDGGTLTLHGPGAMVIREAALGKVRKDQRLTLEVTDGHLEVKVNPGNPHDIRLLSPQASVRLAGTWVLLTATTATTKLAVLDGEAWLTSVAAPRAVRIQAGQLAQVQAGWMTVAQIPIEEWLKRKGLLESAPTPIPAPRESEPAPDAAPMSHEQTEEAPAEP